MAQLAFYEEIKHYEKLETDEERKAAAREIYDNYIMRELLSHSHVSVEIPQLYNRLNSHPRFRLTCEMT